MITHTHTPTPVQLIITLLSQQEPDLQTGTARPLPSYKSQLLFLSFCIRKPCRTKDLNASACKKMRFGGAIPLFQSGVYKKNKNGHVCLGKLELENE